MELSAKSALRIPEIPQHKGRLYQGKIVNNWTVLAHAGRIGRKILWRCRCMCGSEWTVHKDNVMAEKSKACRRCRTRLGQANPAWRGFKDVPGHVFGVMKQCAQMRHLECSVSIAALQEQWERQHGYCALSGLPISIKVNASIDRIDSNIGYVTGNIQWVHNDVNLMKNHLDQAYFIEMCRRIAHV